MRGEMGKGVERGREGPLAREGTYKGERDDGFEASGHLGE
jgi:hypothetical protein